MSVPETRYAKVGDDRVAYQVMGEGPLDVVATGGQWAHLDIDLEEPAVARFYRRLASFGRLIRFNARGSGLSDPRPADGDAAEHWKEDLRATLDTVGSKSAAIVSWIDGSPLALHFAANHPERVRGLVLFNPWASMRAEPGYAEGHPPEVLEQFLSFTHKHYGTEKWVRAANPSLANDERAMRWMAKFLRSVGAPKAIVESFANQQRLDVRDKLSVISAPTLVMARRDNRWTPPPMVRYVAEHIAGARLVELPGADSNPFWEESDLILDHIEQFVTGKRHGGEPDRMLTTVLFTDIVGSTTQAANLGDATWRALLDRHDQFLREQVGLHGGKVADHSGDGSLSTFDNPRRAIECALALQKALSEIGVEIRAGVHFGEVEKRADGGVGGVNVHVGARVMALAGAGEALVSHTVQSILIGSHYVFDDRGAQELRGVPGRWTLYAIGAQKQ
jgi:pimeloyl-ACP methyl ester carboxylesterase